jgi:hypothetical protein
MNSRFLDVDGSGTGFLGSAPSQWYRAGRALWAQERELRVLVKG